MKNVGGKKMENSRLNEKGLLHGWWHLPYTTHPSAVVLSGLWSSDYEGVFQCETHLSAKTQCNCDVSIIWFWPWQVEQSGVVAKGSGHLGSISTDCARECTLPARLWNPEYKLSLIFKSFNMWDLNLAFFTVYATEYISYFLITSVAKKTAVFSVAHILTTCIEHNSTWEKISN